MKGRSKYYDSIKKGKFQLLLSQYKFSFINIYEPYSKIYHIIKERWCDTQ